MLTQITIKDEPIIHVALRDISERKRNEKKIVEQSKELEYQAHYDTLTRLPNRVLFIDRLSQAIKRVERNHEKLAVFFIDLDRFKEINDSFGHDFGDEVLKHVALKFEAVLRAEDTLSRLGGDEFTLLIDGLDEPEEASDVAQNLIETLQEAVEINGQQLYLTCSIGISIYPDDADDAQTMLRNADSAMYRAKESGRNTYQYYTADMTEKAFERVVLESSLRDGLLREEFSVYYQPQIDAKTDTIIGMEALVRWVHPSLGLVSPAKFIPLAEETGLIVPLGEYVLHSAMQQVSLWRSQGLTTGKISVNLSPKQLRGNMVQTIADALERFAFDPALLELEVTEGYVIAEPEKAIKTLCELRDLGVSIAMDDFGTGYSSLSYLKRLPLDKLKIDQSFIRDIPDDSDDKAITRAIISMARSLSLNVIAEGVETEEQLNFLMLEGCHEIQGYYYSRPLPSDECEAYLRNFAQS